MIDDADSYWTVLIYLHEMGWRYRGLLLFTLKSPVRLSSESSGYLSSSSLSSSTLR